LRKRARADSRSPRRSAISVDRAHLDSGIHGKRPPICWLRIGVFQVNARLQIA
jgi:hypothetical protein